MKNFISLIPLFTLFLSACDLSPGASATQVFETAAIVAQTAIAETHAAMPTDTATLPPTETMAPTDTPTITPTATEAFTATPSKVPTVDTANSLAYFVLQMDDDSKDGCSYTPVPLYIGTQRSGDPSADITAALGALFSTHATTVYGYANPLGSSSLQVGTITVEGKDRVNVNITGNLDRGPKSCVWGQLLDQIQYTARHAARGFYVSFQYNGYPIKDFLYTGA